MPLRLLFDRFEKQEDLGNDEIFSFFSALDRRTGDGKVFVVALKEEWSAKHGVIEDLTAYFEGLQRVRRKELPRLLSIVRNPTDGFAVVFEELGERIVGAAPAGGVDLKTLLTAAADALHAAHNQGVCHGVLRADHFWRKGDAVRLAGFGYPPLLRYGWRPKPERAAPEVVAGAGVDARSDVYSLASVLAFVYPETAELEPIRRALAATPDVRHQKIREFAAALEESLRQSAEGGLVPKARPGGGLVPKGSAGSQGDPEPRDVVPKPPRPSDGEGRPPEPPREADTNGRAPGGNGEKPMPLQGEEDLRRQIEARAFDYYCDQRTDRELIQYAIDRCHMAREDARYVIDYELRRIGAANERQLIEELMEQLRFHAHQLGGKLTKKNHDDSIALISRPKPGCRKGLSPRVAEETFLDFCRSHRVKVEKGLWRWEIP